jgi:hypothetical protein
MRLPRFRRRTLMIAVAVVAVGLAGATYARSARFARMAAIYTGRETFHADGYARGETLRFWCGVEMTPAERKRVAERYRQLWRGEYQPGS